MAESNTYLLFSIQIFRYLEEPQSQWSFNFVKLNLNFNTKNVHFLLPVQVVIVLLNTIQIMSMLIRGGRFELYITRIHFFVI